MEKYVIEKPCYTDMPKNEKVKLCQPPVYQKKRNRLAAYFIASRISGDRSFLFAIAEISE
jgi:hypothetical protein